MMMPFGPPDEGRDKEFMSTLAKGLAVLSAFGKQRPAMTLSDAAAVVQPELEETVEFCICRLN